MAGITPILRFLRGHAAFNAVAACAASMLCLTVLGSDTLVAAALSSCACAVVVAPFALAAQLPRVRHSSQNRALKGSGVESVEAIAVLLVCAAAFVSSMIPLLAPLATPVSDSAHAASAPYPLSIASFMLIVAVCVGTGLYEEALFRIVVARACMVGLAMRIRHDHTDRQASPWNRLLTRPHASTNARLRSRRLACATAVCSSFLFALMHLTFPADSSWTSVAAMQVVLKPIQAFLFGMVLSLLYFRRGSFAEIAVLHIGYDFVALGPGLAAAGSLPASYATGVPTDLVVLVASTVLLAFALFAAGWMFRSQERKEAPSDVVK